MPWYYEVDRQQRGPVSDQEFSGLVQAGVVRAETLVWQEGWANWRTYGSVAGGVSDDDTAVCAVSGRRLPKRDMLEFEGRWVSAEHKEEFFQRLREGVSQPTEMVYASFGRRFGAKVIDGVILAVIGGMLGGVMGMLVVAAGPEVALALGVLEQVISIGVGLAYAVYFIRKNDATPGKKWLGLKLVRADGSSLSTGRIVGRYFSEWVSSFILCIGYLMAAFDKEQRRALHDRMCDTRVIDVRGL
jgi:uncharacterized RDD family membrane protein YckC